jgi:Derlin-2/3
MPLTLEQWYRQMPVVTRSYLTLSFLTTAGCALELISPFSVYYNAHLIFRKGQVWRLASNFFFFGSLGMDFVFHMFFLSRYCRLLEEGTFRGRSGKYFLLYHIPRLIAHTRLTFISSIAGDFAWMLVFGAFALSCVAPFVNIQFLGSSLTFMMVYVWGRRNNHVNMSFLGLFSFTAPYLPWVLLVFSSALGSSPTTDLLGVAAGHAFYFLNDVYPTMTDRRVIWTPRIVKKLCGQVDGPEGEVWGAGAFRPEANAGVFAGGGGQALGRALGGGDGDGNGGDARPNPDGDGDR